MKDADILENFQWLQAPPPGLGWGVWACLLAGLILLAGVTWYFIRRKQRGLLSFVPPLSMEQSAQAMMVGSPQTTQGASMYGHSVDP